MQRLTKREAALICDIPLKAKKALLADQVEGISKGIADELLTEQLRVLDKFVAIVVTTRSSVDDQS